MKILYLLFINIKNMITRRAVLFSVLMIGLTISATAISVYYSQSSAMVNRINAFVGVDRAVEFIVLDIKNKDTYSEIGKSARSIRAVKSISLLSEENMYFDIIGLQADKPIYITVEYGTWFSKPGDIIVPYQMLEGKYSDMVGQKFYIGENEYTICGVYNQNNYSPEQFCYNRIDEASFSGAGVDSPDYVSQRNVPGIFMEYSDYVEAQYNTSSIRIRYVDPLSETQANEISATISDHIMNLTGDIVLSDNLMQEAAKQVYNIDFYSKIMLYILLVLLSLVNILSLFLYVIKNNIRQYNTYIKLGLTNSKLYFLVGLEIAVYSVIAFILGWIIKNIIIKNTYLKYTVPTLGIATFLGLISVFVIFSIGVVVLILHRTLNIKAKAENSSIFESILLKLNAKKLYLVSKSNSQNIAKIFLVFQVFFVAFSFSYACTYMYERGAQERFINKYFSGESTLYFVKNDMYYEYTIPPDHSSQNSDDWFYMAPLTDNWQKLINLPDILSKTKGIQDIGYINPALLLNDRENSFNGLLFEYSPGLIKNVEMPLHRGEWLTKWSNGVDILSDKYIPVLITRAKAELENLSVGDEITTELSYFSVCAVPSYNKLRGQFDDETYQRRYSVTIKVVGILKEDVRQITLQSTPPQLDSILSPYSVDNIDYMFCPQLYLGEKPLQYKTLQYTDSLLFVEDVNAIEILNTELSDYGRVYSVKELAQISDGFFKDGSLEYYIHTIISGLLLLIAVAGYNFLMIEQQKGILGIYFACGMPWKNAASFISTSNALLFIFGGVCGSIWAVYSADSIRTMMEDTKIFSIVTGIALIICLFFITSLISILQMKNISPLTLIRNQDTD